ncbi:hypothetical protein [uncultured Gemmiger sp.]|uniref:hypothetical protein n=1 Tax=uncultured Gemmiger sp. TaxID=1623490 RepID=UPI002665CDC9|nr:hypothetical protein [uncultured Gemmiger sp.]
MKNRYYIGKKLVRTSEREYTHAVLYRGRVRACAGSYCLAQKALASCQRFTRQEIADCKAAIAAIDSGETRFASRVQGRKVFFPVNASRSLYVKQLANFEQALEGWEIVELQKGTA